MPRRMSLFMSTVPAIVAMSLATIPSGRAASDNCLAAPSHLSPADKHWRYRMTARATANVGISAHSAGRPTTPPRSRSGRPTRRWRRLPQIRRRGRAAPKRRRTAVLSAPLSLPRRKSPCNRGSTGPSLSNGSISIGLGQDMRAVRSARKACQCRKVQLLETFEARSPSGRPRKRAPLAGVLAAGGRLGVDRDIRFCRRQILPQPRRARACGNNTERTDFGRADRTDLRRRDTRSPAGQRRHAARAEPFGS
jgi:hypothetical protein